MTNSVEMEMTAHESLKGINLIILIFLASLLLLPTSVNAESSSSLPSLTAVGELITTPITYDNNLLYFGTANGSVYCMNALTWETVWSYTSNSSVSFSVEVANELVIFYSDSVYVLSKDGTGVTKVEANLTLPFMVESDELYLIEHNILRCVNATSGLELWKLALDSKISTFTSSDNILFIAAGNTIFRFDKNISKWNKTIDSMALSSICDLENVYLGTGEGIIALDINTGEEAWQYRSYPAGKNLMLADEILVFSSLSENGSSLVGLNTTTKHSVWAYNLGVKEEPNVTVDKYLMLLTKCELTVLNKSSEAPCVFWGYELPESASAYATFGSNSIYLPMQDKVFSLPLTGFYDLCLAEISFAWAEGLNCRVVATVHNKGVLASPENLTLTFFDSTDNITLGTVKIDSIKPYSYAQANLSWEAKHGHWIKVVIEQRELESYPRDNSYTQLVTLQTIGRWEPSVTLTPVTIYLSLALPFIAIILALLYWLSDLWRYRILLPFVIIYSKLKKEDILGDERRAAITQYIRENPGCGFTDIRSRLELSNGSTVHHLYILERSGFIKRVNTVFRSRYYPEEVLVYKLPEVSKEEEPIYNAVKARPGITQSELARELGLSRQLVNNHIRHLVERELIRIERKGIVTKCYIVEPAE